MFSFGTSPATRTALLRSQERNEPLALIVSHLWSVPRLQELETTSAATPSVDDARKLVSSDAVVSSGRRNVTRPGRPCCRVVVSRRVLGRRPLSLARRRFMELIETGWSVTADLIRVLPTTVCSCHCSILSRVGEPPEIPGRFSADGRPNSDQRPRTTVGVSPRDRLTTPDRRVPDRLCLRAGRRRGPLACCGHCWSALATRTSWRSMARRSMGPATTSTAASVRHSASPRSVSTCHARTRSRLTCWPVAAR